VALKRMMFQNLELFRMRISLSPEKSTLQLYLQVHLLASELWENSVFAVGIMGKHLFAVGIMGTFIGIVGTFIFCRNYGKKWEMSRRNYGKISVGTMGKYRRNCGTLPEKAVFQLLFELYKFTLKHLYFRSSPPSLNPPSICLMHNFFSIGAFLRV
jgi:hypothetical protein